MINKSFSLRGQKSIKMWAEWLHDRSGGRFVSQYSQVRRSYHTHFADTQVEHETHLVWRSPPAFWWPTVLPWQRSWSQSCGRTETVLLPFERAKIHFIFSIYVDQRLLLFLKQVLSHLTAYVIMRLSYETRFKPIQKIIIIILNMYLLKLSVVPCLKPFFSVSDYLQNTQASFLLRIIKVLFDPILTALISRRANHNKAYPCKMLACIFMIFIKSCLVRMNCYPWNCYREEYSHSACMNW